ncbi:hypothetical protein [Brevibacillus borstelensis]|uniref:hypothetical protein n=1 Tax=Brevibacillus borstelensis TaxID=45462 RepID=UPI0030FD103B
MSPDDPELLEYLLLFHELPGQYISGEEAIEIRKKFWSMILVTVQLWISWDAIETDRSPDLSQGLISIRNKLIEGEMKKMNSFKGFLLVALILAGISGCGDASETKEENSAVVENPVGKEAKNIMIGEDTFPLHDLKGVQNFKDQFTFAFDPTVHPEIAYYKSGETVTIDFGGTEFNHIAILDVLLDSEGKQLYTDKEIKEVPYTHEDNHYQFKLEKHFASALDSNPKKSKTVYRGFRINAYKDDQEHPFGFVIKTDSY